MNKRNAGQAMIEFSVALVAIMAVVIGTILINRMGLAHISSMAKARGTAGSLAMDLTYHSPLGAQFISDWQAGADNTGYTHDDEPIPDMTAIALVGNIIGTAGLGAITAPTNALSRLQASPDISALNLVKGNEITEIVLHDIPGALRLFSLEHAVTVESEAYLVWTGGIY